MLAEPPAPDPRDTAFRIANLEVRPAELQVLIDDRRAGFTVREFELFFLLSQRIDAVIQRPEIYTLMWGGEMPRRNRSVDVLVRKVRAKLEAGRPRVALHPHPLRHRLPLHARTARLSADNKSPNAPLAAILPKARMA